ncbi:RNA polymerase-associated protein RapA [Thalassovita autumnalis]|uniref:RNA polymerase-associated protein RapA n=1 Tax=Thalassovita autumnalis TaxID=2072972 RepID=A0A0P1G9N1_9RHOB|nr:DEAD/DEAH box helicase family protein [Thalassovita autumnalis]CUH68973.1 RNA polymerase-associated protein RapA [Thalassovita autumnalis]CUH72304.1 RNA polymerase-associated protein RapA [Thalassovita autumnalis]
MNTFHLAQSGFHALERLVAAESWEMGGALGVAADPYPHQIANLRRILADTEIRHLLADEVGMGKTVQALMILNILRRRDPSLRVAIVAPERICYQWQVELSARGHIAAHILTDADEEQEHPDGEGYVHLIKADMVCRQPARPSPEYYDMLIVDEVHAMNLDDATFLSNMCRERGNSPRFRHVLLLTATPRLGNPAWAQAVIGAIEPERSAIANLLGREPLEFIAEEAAAARGRVADGALSAAAYRTAFAADRRILRQTRSQWPGVAPTRKVRTVRTAPSDAEIPKIMLQNAACRDGRDSTIASAPWLQCCQMFRAGSSLRAVLRHRTFSAYPDLRDEVESTLSRNPGNALFDDLCDVLLGFWQKDAERRIIVVAGDTPTVDMLERRLSDMFPHLSDGGIATMRGRYNTDLVDVVSAVQSQATVLIMEEFVEAGLNLHNFAADMIFYNLPWQASRIDQLIGRLDRLRSGGLSAYIKDRTVGTIGIWRLVVAGSADERVLEALDLLDVFEHPLPYLDEALSQRIDGIITDAAAGRANFRQAASELKEELSFGLNQSGESVATVAPGTPDDITEVVGSIREAEHAGNTWLRLLHVSGALKGGFPKANDGERVATLSLPLLLEKSPYKLGAMTTQESEVFRWRRDRLGKPPKKDVVLPNDRLGKRARFFSTGDELHDDLVRQAYATLKAGTVSPIPVGVHLSDDNLAADLIGKTILLVRSAWRPSLLKDKQLRVRDDDVPAVRVGRLSDRRWISTLFPDAVRTRCLVVSDDGSVEVCTDEIARALLREGCKPTTNRQIQMTISPFRQVQKLVTALEREMIHEDRQCLGKLREEATAAFSDRKQILTSETETYVRWKQLSIEQLRLRNITDQQQIQMTEGQIAAEQRRMETRISGMTDRLRSLEDALLSLANHSKTESYVILVRVLPSPKLSI